MPNPALRWACAFAVWTAVAQMLSDQTGGWQFDRAHFDAGAWWQLLTAQWVHFGFSHAALNVIGMGLMLQAFQGVVHPRVQWAALLGGYLGVACVVALDPVCAYYAGASGALHGLWAGAAVALLVVRPPAEHRLNGGRILGLLLLMALWAKLGLQGGASQWGVPDFSMPAWSIIPVYHPAHGAGALGGGVAAALYGWWGRRSLAQHPG